MYIHGDGRTEIYHDNGLLDNGYIKENSFDKIFTNPPFGSKISKKAILKKFELAGEHRKMQRSEVLFLERCINLLKQDGEMAIVLPDIILNGANNKKTRKFIFHNCQILAIISLPSQTFVKSGASVKTSLLFLKKKPLSKICNNKIFMAMPEKVGFDSVGREDESQLGKITDSFVEFRKGNEFKEDEIVFTVSVQDIADRIDPKVYRTQKEINTEFDIVRLDELVKPKKEKIKIADGKTYKRVTIKLYGKGLEQRDKITGTNIGTKNQFIISEGDFIFSKIDARNGAFGIVPHKLDNAIVTNSFPYFKIDTKRIIPQFLEEIAKAEKFYSYFQKISIGTTGRKTITIDKFLSLNIPLPSLEYQKILLEKIN